MFGKCVAKIGPKLTLSFACHHIHVEKNHI